MSTERNWISALVKDRLALLGIVLIGICTFIAVMGAYLRPDSSKDANAQYLPIARQAPGFKAQFFVLPTEDKQESGFLSGLFFGGLPAAEERWLTDSLAIEGSGLTLYWRGDRVAELTQERLGSGPDVPLSLADLQRDHLEEKTYLLGTDSFGRDMLSRLMGGALVSLSVGFISVLISLLIGIGLGALAGYFGGWVDDVVMWMINVIWSIPTLLMVIAITLVMGKGFVQVFVAVGLTMWVEVARIVRGQFLALRAQPYVEAGRAMGFGAPRLILRHMLPNAMGPVIVISAANFASAILIEAGLSFLGIGTQIPTPSWGGMIKEHYAYITTDMAYLAILPGICITVLVLSFMLIGNRLRDVLDVRS